MPRSPTAADLTQVDAIQIGRLATITATGHSNHVYKAKGQTNLVLSLVAAEHIATAPKQEPQEQPQSIVVKQVMVPTLIAIMMASVANNREINNQGFQFPLRSLLRFA